MNQGGPPRPTAVAAHACWTLCARAEVPPGDDWLGEREREALARLRFPKRRADWRLGRWTAKQALARCLGVDGAAPPLARIEVLAAPDGAPEVLIPGIAPPAIALSHSGERGFALACRPARPVGCDLERVEARSRDFVSDYLTIEEAALVEGADPSTRPVLATLLWSAKESALKLRREGLRADTRAVHVQPASDPVTAQRGRFTVATDRGEGAVPLRGCWWLAGEYVRTVVLALMTEPEAWQAPDERADWSLPPV